MNYNLASLALVMGLVKGVTGTENLALGQPTWQSSLGAGGLSDRAVDGNRNGEYWNASCTHTYIYMDEYPWWAVDLRRRMTVTSVTISNRVDCCSERLANFVVGVRMLSPQNATLPQHPLGLHICNHIHNTSVAPTFDVTCAQPVFGRYVVVQMYSRHIPLTLCEVEVYGGQPSGFTYSTWKTSAAALNSMAELNDDSWETCLPIVRTDFSDGSILLRTPTPIYTGQFHVEIKSSGLNWNWDKATAPALVLAYDCTDPNTCQPFSLPIITCRKLNVVDEASWFTCDCSHLTCNWMAIQIYQSSLIDETANLCFVGY